MRNIESVIQDIRMLVSTKGYIYALCMILFEDFHINLEKAHEIDYRKRLSTKEASLLLGFLIQNEIDFLTPNTPEDLIQLKNKTYELMEELHHSFNIPFIEIIHKSIEEKHEIQDFRKEQKEFFGKGLMLIESIFYSGTGVYDLQYLDFLEKKYKYDKQWLFDNKNFNIEEVKNIVIRIKDVLQEKSKKVHLYELKERLPQFIKEMKKKEPDKDWEKHSKEVLPILELHQYVELFFEYTADKDLNLNDIRKEGWKSFYEGLIELFVVRKSDLGDCANIDSFLDNFSISFQENLNSQFQSVGNFNLINAKPIIQLDRERYFIPISFLLFEAVYESPYYWMEKDDSYRNILAEHRGLVGEEITYEFLSKVFGKTRTFRSVKIKTPSTKTSTKRKIDATDIDILCILGSKTLCVQVKSKKLTELSRTGNDQKLQKDFQGAVQDAYVQGMIAREKILEKHAEFFDNQGSEIKLSEEIDDVYILVVTIENYPSLTHQAHILLDKNGNDPYPMVSTIFDLELLVHYLHDPFDFLYYIRQRIALMDYFRADEEIVFLGYHLERKLWKINKVDMIALETDFGQAIDRNYYPLKLGLQVSDRGDTIKHRWKNEEFDRLCEQLKTIKRGKVTDIIFHLLDLSGETRKTLVDLIIKTKNQTLKDGKIHDFTMPLDVNLADRVGITYIALNSDDVDELQKRLLTFCQIKKYTSKSGVWIGFGSLKNSSKMIDSVAFNDQKWKYNEDLEQASAKITHGKKRGQLIRLSKKIGRNEKCPCGSMLKYKKCCGKNK